MTKLHKKQAAIKWIRVRMNDKRDAQQSLISVKEWPLKNFDDISYRH